MRLRDFSHRMFLGKGGEAEVYRAREGTLHRVVVLKSHIIKTVEKVNSKEFLNNLLLTYKQIASKRIAGTPLLIGAFKENNRFWICMDWIDGVTLEQLIEFELSQTQKVALSKNICSALASLHGHGIIHGDIKPSNIMVTTKGEIVVLDLGFALPDTTHNNFNGYRGTPAYSAPEQFGSEAYNPITADIYSLCCVLCRLFGVSHSAFTPPSTRSVEQCDAIPEQILMALRMGIDQDATQRPGIESLIALFQKHLDQADQVHNEVTQETEQLVENVNKLFAREMTRCSLDAARSAYTRKRLDEAYDFTYESLEWDANNDQALAFLDSLPELKEKRDLRGLFIGGGVLCTLVIALVVYTIFPKEKPIGIAVPEIVQQNYFLGKTERLPDANAGSFRTNSQTSADVESGMVFINRNPAMNIQIHSAYDSSSVAAATGLTKLEPGKYMVKVKKGEKTLFQEVHSVSRGEIVTVNLQSRQKGDGDKK